MSTTAAPSPMESSFSATIDFNLAMYSSNSWTTECIPEHIAKSELYHKISVNYSKASPWYAVHAMIWSDMYITAAEIQPLTLPPIGVADISKDSSPRAVMLQIREMLIEFIPAELIPQWESKLYPIDHLPVKSTSEELPQEMFTTMKRHLQKYNFETRCGMLEHQARMLAADGQRMAEENPTEAIQNMYKADLKTFERWMLNRSLLYGDAFFVQSALLWDAIIILLADTLGLPSDFREAVENIRKKLYWVVEPWERESLQSYFVENTGYSTTPLTSH